MKMPEHVWLWIINRTDSLAVWSDDPLVANELPGGTRYVHIDVHNQRIAGLERELYELRAQRDVEDYNRAMEE